MGDKIDYLIPTTPNYISEGNSISVGFREDLRDEDPIVVKFAYRLTPEFIGQHRSLRKLGERDGTSYSFSNNRRSVERCMTFSQEAAKTLGEALLGEVGALGLVRERGIESVPISKGKSTGHEMQKLL